MLRLFSIAALTAAVVLPACTPHATLPVRIVPLDGQSGSVSFCRMTGTNPNSNLVVRLHNPNTQASKLPMDVSVTFSTNPAVTRTAQSSTLPPNTIDDVSVPVPGQCFRPDCNFAIRVRDRAHGTIQAFGSCIG